MPSRPLPGVVTRGWERIWEPSSICQECLVASTGSDVKPLYGQRFAEGSALGAGRRARPQQRSDGRGDVHEPWAPGWQAPADSSPGQHEWDLDLLQAPVGAVQYSTPREAETPWLSRLGDQIAELVAGSQGSEVALV